MELTIIALYFLPVIVALLRGHKNTLAITALTVLTGWTFLGWIIAAVWSCTSNVKAPKKIFE